jgi:nucleoside-diphosphate-sugar epimerase
MRVVVVGASGNVGTAVLRRLSAEPAVTALVGVARRPPDGAGPPYDAATWVSADVSAPDAVPRLADAFADADSVVHLAWRLQPSWDLDTLERINVHGTRAVVDAALAAGVGHLAYASSIGAYAPSPGDEPRDESWPTAAVESSSYSRQKVAVERMLDGVDPGRLGVLRVRPGIVLQPDAAAEIARYFLGPLVPTGLIRPVLLPVLPWPRGLRGQIVHADDLADAFARGILARATGGLNVATHPLVTRELVAGVLGARPVDVPRGPVRGLAAATWRAHLQPTEPGWLDLALNVPVMDTGRARGELGWSPAHPAGETLGAFLAALARGRGTASAVMRPRSLVFGRRANG